MEQHSAQKNRVKLIAIGIGAIALLSIAAILAVGIAWRPEPVDLSAYVTVERDAAGEPIGEIDTEALLKDLHLPSAADERATDRYEDVRAIAEMELFLGETETEDTVQVAVLADTERLKAHGITFAALTWEQPMKGWFAGSQGDTVDAPDDGENEKEPSPSQNGGILLKLVDAEGNGYNLRSVCEAIQTARDRFLEQHFGPDVSFQKVQVAFSVNDRGTENSYQAAYRAWATPSPEETTVYFRVSIGNLSLENGRVIFQGVNVTQHKKETDCKRLAFSNGVILSGGGVKVSQKRAFDQNGFVQFAGKPTSYRMANGVYWSPTYDKLEEDDIWKLTATEGYSLAKLLRYARKEIYARYYASFDEHSEREFGEHYAQYPWYHVLTPDRTADMTETERSNMRLLREIQSLIEK